MPATRRIVDGAAAVLVGNKAAGRKAGLKPAPRIRGLRPSVSDLALVLTGLVM